MAWDFAINHDTWDLTSGYVSGQDEIIQRVKVRLWRHLGEWFVNTSAGLPWYDGPSDIAEGLLTRETGMLGSRDFQRVDLLVRNEIAETTGVVKILDFKTSFNAETGEYKIDTRIATEFGVSNWLTFGVTAQ